MILWVLVPIGAVVALALASKSPELFVYGGLLLASSNRFLTYQIHHGFTLKPGYVLFGLALAGSIIRHVRDGTRPAWPDVPRVFFVSALALLALYLVAAVAGDHTTAEARELLIIAGGAVVPAMAILSAIDSRERVDRALAVFVLAQVVVAGYALYQFAAGYLHLPQPVGESSTLGPVHRVSAFSYEPAYYGAYVVTALPLLLCDVMRGTRRLGPVHPVALASFVVLAGALTLSRATFLAVPLVLVGVWYLVRTQRSGKRERPARALIPFAVTIVTLGSIALGGLLLAGPSTRDRIGSTIAGQLGGSNELRKAQYRAAGRVIQDHPVLGVGPGNLGNALPGYGVHVPRRKTYVATANDIWLQGAVDAGVLAIPLIAGLVLGTGLAVRRRSVLSARALALGSLVFLLVNGAFVSLLWDMKFWTVFALALAVHRAFRADAPREEPVAHRELAGLTELVESSPADREDPTPLPR